MQIEFAVAVRTDDTARTDDASYKMLTGDQVGRAIRALLVVEAAYQKPVSW